jgi:transcriptional regulator with XRE-family HTH domain
MNRHPLVEVIVAERKRRGWTQADLAEATGRSVSSINHFENDPGGRNIAVIEEIAEPLGLQLGLVPIGFETHLRAAS